MPKDNRRFQRGSGVYECYACNKTTRDTGKGEASLGLCLRCFQDSSWENYHSDNCADAGRQTAKEDCESCRAAGFTTAYKFSP